MMPRSFRVWTLALALLVGPSAAQAQFPATRLYTLFPSGGQVGQTTEVTVTGGDDLEELDALLFSHPGITATPKLNDQKQPINQVFLVTVAADVPPGLYEAYTRGLWGVSNPRRFIVGTRPQVNEVEPNNTPDKPQAATLNQAIFGRMDGGTDVDWYSFVAQKGQRIVFDCMSARIDSRMEPVLEILDPTGRRRLAQAKLAGAADPQLVFDVPVDGEYRLRIHDVTYRNGGEYFYRLDIHAGPQVLFAWPPVGTAGQTQKVALVGYNLPGSQRIDLAGIAPQPERVEVDVPFPGDVALLQAPEIAKPVSAGTDSFQFRWISPAGPANAVTFGITSAPVIVETEPNNAAPGQSVPVPVTIAGQFGQRNDADVFTFEAKALDVLFLDVVGERRGSSVDPYFTIDRVITAADGKETLQRISVADDDPTPGVPNVFDTRSDDASLRLDVPEDAKYRVTVRDRYGVSRGSSELLYQLTIRKDQPDFRLVAVPAAPTPTAVWPVGLRKGDQFGITILAFRRDGFTGPIDVSAIDLPAGITAAPTRIGEGKPSTLLVLTAADATAEPFQNFRILGKAAVEDSTLTRKVATTNAQIIEAEKPLPPLQKAVADATPKRDQAQQALAKAEEDLKAKPDDANLVKQRDAAKTALDQAQVPLTQAQTNLDAATKKIADLRMLVAETDKARVASIHPVERFARFGNVQFTGQNNQPALARLTDHLPISVMKEAAPIQMTADPVSVDVWQGAQVLVPFHLTRRNGFEEKVTGAIQNLPPNTNIDVPQVNFEKGTGEQLARFFVKENAPPGQQVIWFTSSTPVSYRRNPAKADRAKAAFDAAATAAKTAQDLAQVKTQEKTDATNKANAAAELQKKVQGEKEAAVKTQQEVAQKLAQAKQVLVTAEKAATDAATAVTNNEAAVATAKTASDADQANADLKQKLAAAEQGLAKAKEAATKAETDKQGAAKAAADLEPALKAADDAIKAKETELAKATADNTAAQQVKTAAEQAEQQAQNQAKQLEEARKGAEKVSNDLANATKAANVNFITVTQPILINVKPAPFKLALGIPGPVKKGDKVEVKVMVARQNGFAGPVKVSLPAIPNLKGLAAVEVEVPADKNEGILTITAAGDAADGMQANLVVRGTADFGGPAQVDAPAPLQVTP